MKARIQGFFAAAVAVLSGVIGTAKVADAAAVSVNDEERAGVIHHGGYDDSTDGMVVMAKVKLHILLDGGNNCTAETISKNEMRVQKNRAMPIGLMAGSKNRLVLPWSRRGLEKKGFCTE